MDDDEKMVRKRGEVTVDKRGEVRKNKKRDSK